MSANAAFALLAAVVGLVAGAAVIEQAWRNRDTCDLRSTLVVVGLIYGVGAVVILLGIRV